MIFLSSNTIHTDAQQNNTTHFPNPDYPITQPAHDLHLGDLSRSFLLAVPSFSPFSRLDRAVVVKTVQGTP